MPIGLNADEADSITNSYSCRFLPGIDEENELEAGAGLEPAAGRLWVCCSTIELPRKMDSRSI